MSFQVVGSQIEVVELPNFKTVTLSLSIPIGSAFEEIAGLNSVTFESMERQTSSLVADSLAEFMDRSGISGGFHVGRSSSRLTLRAPPKNAGKVIRLAQEMLFSPSFSDEILHTIVERQKSFISHIYSSPEEILRHYLRWDATFGNDPITRHPIGKADDLDQITISHLEEWNARITSSDGVLVFTSPSGVSSAYRKELDDLISLFGGKQLKKDLCTRSSRKFYKTSMKPQMPSSNTYIGINMRTSPPVPETFTTLVFRSLVGFGTSTRLHKEIREKRNLSYAPLLVADSFPGGGFVTARMDVRPERALEALKITLKVLDSAINHPISSDELNRAKKIIWSTFAFVKDTSRSFANFLLARLKYGLDPDLERIRREVSDTFDSDWQKELQQWWKPENISFAISGEDLSVLDKWDETVEVFF